MFFNPNNLFIGIFCLCLYHILFRMKKEEQKQHIVDMMKSDELLTQITQQDEELGLYDESREIKFEDIFNEEKKEKLKKFISEHKKKDAKHI